MSTQSHGSRSDTAESAALSVTVGVESAASWSLTTKTNKQLNCKLEKTLLFLEQRCSDFAPFGSEDLLKEWWQVREDELDVVREQSHKWQHH